MLRAERDGATAVLTLARPEVRNALDERTLRALADAVDAASADPRARAIVLRGEGPAFCAGGDLGELRARTSEADAAALSDLGARVAVGLARAPKLVVAAVHGPALGGGAELALACDVRVVSAGARFAFKHARMGTTTAWGGAARLERLVGAGVARLLLLTACEVDAFRAVDIGLAELNAEDATAAALELAQGCAACGPSAVRELKALLDTGGARAAEREAFVRTWSSAEHAEAVEAHFARRPPRWD